MIKMINNTYAKAYTEVLEIVKYFPKEEYSKIPLEKINFYKKNMDRNYHFSINPELDLSEQSISKEANAIIVTLFRDYFATEEQKIKLTKILENNQKKEEEEKREKYNPDNIFKDYNKQENDKNENQINTNTQLIKYQESFFTKFKNFILRLLNERKK